MSKNTGDCPVAGCGKDVAQNWLGKIGITRSLLVTLALVPFAWDGVLWFRDAVATIWDSVTTWGG
jgi:hypothetical protein